ncbi:MAG: TIGR02186 family protein [Pseudomonadota bacterium]
MRAVFILMLMLVGGPATIPALAQAPPRLIADLSQSRIDIVYSFAGAELLVFGAIQYPGGITPDERPDIAIVVRGPPQAITVRQKAQIFGLWLNTDAVRFETAPSFYRAASTRPIPDLVDERTAAIFELGPDYLQLSPTGQASAEMIGRFETGLLENWRAEGLYGADPNGVDLVEKILYRARIDLPSKVPVGNYTVEIHLIEDGEILSSTTRTIEVGKSGFERAVYTAAQDQGFFYGLLAVSLALILGWAASVVVRR